MLDTDLSLSNKGEKGVLNNTIFDDRDYQLWALLHQTRHVIHETLNKDMAPLGVSPRQAAALLVVESNDKPVTPAQISRWLGRDSASVTVLLNRMERKGLINKNRNPDQKNSIIVTLTEKGKETCTLVKNVEVIHKVFSRLSDEQHLLLKECLEILWSSGIELLNETRRKLPYT